MPIWRLLEAHCGPRVGFRRGRSTLGCPWPSKVLPGRSKVGFSLILGSDFGGLGASLFDKSRPVEHDFSMHAFRRASVSVLCWFVVVLGGPRT